MLGLQIRRQPRRPVVSNLCRLRQLLQLRPAARFWKRLRYAGYDSLRRLHNADAYPDLDKLRGRLPLAMVGRQRRYFTRLVLRPAQRRLSPYSLRRIPARPIAPAIHLPRRAVLPMRSAVGRWAGRRKRLRRENNVVRLENYAAARPALPALLHVKHVKHVDQLDDAGAMLATVPMEMGRLELVKRRRLRRRGGDRLRLQCPDLRRPG